MAISFTVLFCTAKVASGFCLIHLSVNSLPTEREVSKQAHLSPKCRLVQVNLRVVAYIACFHPHLSGRIHWFQLQGFDPTGEDGNWLIFDCAFYSGALPYSCLHFAVVVQQVRFHEHDCLPVPAGLPPPPLPYMGNK